LTKVVHFTVTRGPWLYGWSLGNVGYYQAGDINIWRLYWFLSFEYERTVVRTGIFPKKIFSLTNFCNLRGKWSHLATLRYWDHFGKQTDIKQKTGSNGPVQAEIWPYHGFGVWCAEIVCGGECEWAK
jgi:hypothetical protein